MIWFSKSIESGYSTAVEMNFTSLFFFYPYEAFLNLMNIIHTTFWTAMGHHCVHQYRLKDRIGDSNSSGKWKMFSFSSWKLHLDFVHQILIITRHGRAIKERNTNILSQTKGFTKTRCVNQRIFHTPTYIPWEKDTSFSMLTACPEIS